MDVIVLQLIFLCIFIYIITGFFIVFIVNEDLTPINKFTLFIFYPLFFCILLIRVLYLLVKNLLVWIKTRAKLDIPYFFSEFGKSFIGYIKEIFEQK